jgi:hypothetical protein
MGVVCTFVAGVDAAVCDMTSVAALRWTKAHPAIPPTAASTPTTTSPTTAPLFGARLLAVPPQAGDVLAEAGACTTGVGAP